jgi:Ras GTPase-activating-like protein IQGAP2/3
MIRVQTGPDLLSIMVQPITDMDEDRWAVLIDEELRAHNQPRRRSAYADTASIAPSTVASASSHLDILSLSYTELKTTCLENILRLEQAGRVSRHTRYQELLNAIAVDIRTKHRRRIQRAREIDEVRKTLVNLDEKSRWLEDQLKSYNDYIEQAMVTLQKQKGKKKFLLPFTKQYNHEKELQRTGRVPKFGSYKYSARALADKGVLVAWAGYGPEHYNRLDITISSNRVGIFLIEGSQGTMMIPGASAEVPLDDLLQAQFDNHSFMNLFQTGLNAGAKGEGQGALRLNVNLFLHLVFKKFYKEA